MSLLPLLAIDMDISISDWLRQQTKVSYVSHRQSLDGSLLTLVLAAFRFTGLRVRPRAGIV